MMRRAGRGASTTHLKNMTSIDAFGNAHGRDGRFTQQTRPETAEPLNAQPDVPHPVDLNDRDGWEEYLSTHLNTSAMRVFQSVAMRHVALDADYFSTEPVVFDLCTDVALLACEHTTYHRIYGDLEGDDTGQGLRRELDQKWESLTATVAKAA